MTSHRSRRTLRLVAGTLLLAAAVPALAAPSAQADGYAPPVVGVTGPQRVTGGSPIVGQASADKACTWAITFDGPTSTSLPITGTGTSISFTIATSSVTAPVDRTVTATCGYDDGTATPSALRPATVVRSLTVTVAPADAVGGVSQTPSASASPAVAGESAQGDDDGGEVEAASDVLPATGGPRLLVGLAGLGLVGLGALAITRNRRRPLAD